ncbi:hypothetical protein CLOSTASPAR_04266 [[Clostridium] asparagiforme DSM 15981]|uniref:Uncharacterized protein n=1 Tax=[Clostridium] asparagiforme DSM 15981 TaxID=518636 RepID=C0D4S0_9FIRM|nr:hypothetical protein CLOSTASPAR_04266 [[Clostridium] asparagiforme DSM 15981]
MTDLKICKKRNNGQRLHRLPIAFNKTEQLSVRLGAGGQLLCSVSYHIQF